MNKKISPKVKTKKFHTIFVLCLLLIITLLGGYLRSKGIFEGSFGFTYDIGRDLLAVSQMITSYKPLLIGPTTGLEGVFYGPWWYYFLAIPFILFQGDPTWITFFIALIGTSNIVLGFWLGKKIGGDFTAVVLASYIAFSQYLIGLSTQIWSPNLIPTFMLIILLILFRILSDKQYKSTLLLIAGIILGLTVEVEIIFGLLFFFSLAVFSIFNLRKQISKKGILYVFIGIVIVELPRILFELRHSFLMSKSILGASSNPSALSLDTIVKRENFTELRYVFENLFSTTMSGNNTILGYLLFAFCIAIFILYYKKANVIEKKLSLLIILTCLIFYVAFVLYPNGLWNHYLVGLPVLFIVLVTIAINLFRKNFPFKQVAYIFPFIIFWMNVNPITTYLESKMPLWEGSASVYRNQLGVVDYVYKEAKGRNFKYVVYTPPLHDYTYRYLFPWYGKKYYNKTPSEKAELAYFIVEPDDNYGKRRLDWLEKRKSDGTIIKEEYLPGFILVQTKITK